jgi:predicted Zn-dependent protease with MMP-like domain
MDNPRLSVDQFTRLLEEAVSQLPQEIFKDLNLGIGVVESHRLNRGTGSGNPAYTLGEYRASHSMGRGIVLFYGSFMRVYPDMADDARSKARIMAVLKHELTHHLESLAGARDLEITDAKRLLEM